MSSRHLQRWTVSKITVLVSDNRAPEPEKEPCVGFAAQTVPLRREMETLLIGHPFILRA